MSPRQQALAEAVEAAAVDAQALSLRLAALGGVRPSVAAHAQRIADASLVLRDAAVALHEGSTPGIRLFFGEYLRSDDAHDDHLAYRPPVA